MPSPAARSTRIAVFATLVATAVAVPASFAQTPPAASKPSSVKVDYSDLNLATDAGSRVLYHRLVSAAERVCPDVGYMMDLKQNREAHRCITDTVARSAREIKHPKFAQVAAAQTR